MKHSVNQRTHKKDFVLEDVKVREIGSDVK